MLLNLLFHCQPPDTTSRCNKIKYWQRLWFTLWGQWIPKTTVQTSLLEHWLSLREVNKPPVKLVSQWCRGHLTGATHLKIRHVRKTHFDNRSKHSSPHVWFQHASIQQTDCEGGFNQLLNFSSTDNGAHTAPASGYGTLFCQSVANNLNDSIYLGCHWNYWITWAGTQTLSTLFKNRVCAASGSESKSIQL